MPREGGLCGVGSNDIRMFPYCGFLTSLDVLFFQDLICDLKKEIIIDLQQKLIKANPCSLTGGETGCE